MIKRSLLLSLLLATGGLHAQAPDLDRAKQLADSICVGCHAADGNSTIADNPKLAGQIPEYTYKQLRNFASINGNPPARPNAIMGSMVAALSDEDKLSLAHFYAQQTLQPEVAQNAETVEQGREIWRAGIASKGVPACAACHGPTGAGMPAQYPRIAGQHAKYTLTQLQAFRDGNRANDPAEMMRSIALKMTDKEMAAVADYAAGLR
ncbi:MAG: cytochrome c4 [Pseudazoarcus pumilus]|nr:cytochrome c4 [Pseudazoarcus pumilus]